MEKSVVNPWNAPSTHAGSVYNFSAPSHTAQVSCANCLRQEDSGARSTGQVPITNTLLRHVLDDNKPLDSLHRQQVEMYLIAHLSWTITTVRQIPPPTALLGVANIHALIAQQIGGQTIPLDVMPSLNVSVAVGTVVHHEETDMLSHYSRYEVLHSVTPRISSIAFASGIRSATKPIPERRHGSTTEQIPKRHGSAANDISELAAAAHRGLKSSEITSFHPVGGGAAGSTSRLPVRCR